MGQCQQHKQQGRANTLARCAPDRGAATAGDQGKGRIRQGECMLCGLIGSWHALCSLISASGTVAHAQTPSTCDCFRFNRVRATNRLAFLLRTCTMSV